MDVHRLAGVLRSLAPDSSRRVILSALAAGPLALWPWTHAEDAAAKKKRKKRKNTKRKKKGQQGESCAESCHHTEYG